MVDRNRNPTARQRRKRKPTPVTLKPHTKNRKIVPGEEAISFVHGYKIKKSNEMRKEVINFLFSPGAALLAGCFDGSAAL